MDKIFMSINIWSDYVDGQGKRMDIYDHKEVTFVSNFLLVGVTLIEIASFIFMTSSWEFIGLGYI